MAMPEDTLRSLNELFGEIDVEEDVQEGLAPIPVTAQSVWQSGKNKIVATQRAMKLFQESGSDRRSRLERLKEMMQNAHATIAWRAKKQNAIENYRTSLAFTQAHGKEAKQVQNATRLYIADAQLSRSSPKPQSWKNKGSAQDARAFVQQEMNRLLHRVCPQAPSQVTCLYDPVVDERQVMHIIVDFDSSAAAQGALRALRRECCVGKKDAAWSWRYCGLAWEPDVICGTTSRVSRPPSFHKHTQLFNLTDIGREQLQVEQAVRKPKTKFTFSCAPASYSDACRLSDC